MSKELGLDVEWVYPRVYGGTDACQRQGTSQTGLSPRVRGNPWPAGTCKTRCGSIPACTGEPDIGIPGSHKAQVYPRVYGGTRSAR